MNSSPSLSRVAGGAPRGRNTGTDLSPGRRAAEETSAAASQVLAAFSELSHQSDHRTVEVSRLLSTVRAA
jgi:methyl-accepting chemotaxis protein